MLSLYQSLSLSILRIFISCRCSRLFCIFRPKFHLFLFLYDSAHLLPLYFRPNNRICLTMGEKIASIPMNLCNTPSILSIFSSCFNIFTHFGRKIPWKQISSHPKQANTSSLGETYLYSLSVFIPYISKVIQKMNRREIIGQKAMQDIKHQGITGQKITQNTMKIPKN